MAVTTTLCDRLSALNAALPVGSVPPEILQEIFTHANLAALSEGKPPCWTRPDRRKPLPIRLSHVSRRWRTVALHLTSLWSQIDISPPWSLKTIRFFLRRSNSCPIHITLSVSPDDDDEDEAQLFNTTISSWHHLLCGLLAPHIPRCTHITIKGDFTERLMPLLDAFLSCVRMATPAPRLRSLVLYASGSSDPEFYHEFRDALVSPLFTRAAPYLSHIHASALTLPSPQAGPFPNLTSLHLAVGDPGCMYHRLSFIDFTDLLNNCPNLGSLSFCDDVILPSLPSSPSSPSHRYPETLHDETDNQKNQDTIYLPLLTNLRIYGAFLCLPDLLDALHAPSLQSLAIAPIASDEILQWAFRAHQRKQQQNWHSGKFSTLKALTLAPIRSKSFFQIFTLAAACFPTIESLAIPNVPPARTLDDAFTALRRKHATITATSNTTTATTTTTTTEPQDLHLHLPMVVPVDITAKPDLENTQPLFPNLTTLSLRGSLDEDVWTALERAIVFREKRMCPIKTINLTFSCLRVGMERRRCLLERNVGLVQRDVWRELREEVGVAPFDDDGESYVGDYLW